MAKKKEPVWKVSSAADAKRSRLIEMTAPSGTAYVIQAMTLDELAAIEALPDDLMRVALLHELPNGYIGELAAKLDDPKKLAEAKALSRAALDLRNRLVAAAVVQPKLTAKELVGLDPFDKSMIAEICQRKRSFDAVGRRVGWDTLETFRSFAEELGCDPDSEAFARAVRSLAGVQ